MELLLIRHGQSLANLDDQLQGWGDAPLSPEGEREAALLGQHTKLLQPLAAIYASPLRRAMQTAGAITLATGVPPVVRAGFKEMNLGLLEGLTIPEVEARWPGLMGRWVTGRPDVDLPGGESAGAFYSRILGTLRRVLTRHLGSDDRVVIVSHGGAINTMVSYLRSGVANSWVQGVGNCSISHIELSGGPTLKSAQVRELLVNDMRHLGKTYEPWGAVEAVTGKAV